MWSCRLWRWISKDRDVDVNDEEGEMMRVKGEMMKRVKGVKRDRKNK